MIFDTVLRACQSVIERDSPLTSARGAFVGFAKSAGILERVDTLLPVDNSAAQGWRRRNNIIHFSLGAVVSKSCSRTSVMSGSKQDQTIPAPTKPERTTDYDIECREANDARYISSYATLLRSIPQPLLLQLCPQERAEAQVGRRSGLGLGG